MDEPNSALSAAETERLFALLRRLRDKGLTIIYVSHRLEEVFAIADRISVIRDGRYQGTWAIAETSIPDVIAQMIGRRLGETFPHREVFRQRRLSPSRCAGCAPAPRSDRSTSRSVPGRSWGSLDWRALASTTSSKCSSGLTKPTAGGGLQGPCRAAAIPLRGDPQRVRADPGQSPGRGVDDLMVDPAQLEPGRARQAPRPAGDDRPGPRAGTRERLRAEAQRRHRQHRQAGDQSLRRQPAKGGRCQMAGDRSRDPHPQ